MEIASNPSKPLTSDLLTRQLTAQGVDTQAAASFMSQLARPSDQSSGLLQADGLPSVSQNPSADNLAVNLIASLTQNLAPPNLATANQAGASQSPLNPSAASPELRQAFQDFVGQTFFSEMIKACRSGQKPSAYFNGGRAEEIFQGQLDQVMSEELSKSSAEKISDPMFELFMLKRQS